MPHLLSAIFYHGVKWWKSLTQSLPSRQWCALHYNELYDAWVKCWEVLTQCLNSFLTVMCPPVTGEMLRSSDATRNASLPTCNILCWVNCNILWRGKVLRISDTTPHFLPDSDMCPVIFYDWDILRSSDTMPHLLSAIFSDRGKCWEFLTQCPTSFLTAMCSAMVAAAVSWVRGDALATVVVVDTGPDPSYQPAI